IHRRARYVMDYAIAVVVKNGIDKTVATAGKPSAIGAPGQKPAAIHGISADASSTCQVAFMRTLWRWQKWKEAARQPAGPPRTSRATHQGHAPARATHQP